MSVLPIPRPSMSPLLTVATAGFDDDHVADLVTSVFTSGNMRSPDEVSEGVTAVALQVTFSRRKRLLHSTSTEVGVEGVGVGVGVGAGAVGAGAAGAGVAGAAAVGVADVGDEYPPPQFGSASNRSVDVHLVSFPISKENGHGVLAAAVGPGQVVFRDL